MVFIIAKIIIPLSIKSHIIFGDIIVDKNIIISIEILYIFLKLYLNIYFNATSI